MWNYRSHTIFWVCVLTAGVLLAQMTLYVLQVLFRWNLPMNIFDICHSWLGSLGLPLIPLMLDGLIMSTFAVSIWHIGRQAAAFLQAKRRIDRLKEHCLTEELDRRFTGGAGKLLVVEHKQPIALTMGFSRPQIVLSTGLIGLLDESELEAVIRHEEYHLIHLDPLKTLLTYMASSILWYIPILK
jgi:Zn-dependent protease with chaperone function